MDVGERSHCKWIYRAAGTSGWSHYRGSLLSVVADKHSCLLLRLLLRRRGATRGAMVSTSASLACHQC